jgi:hypothetical protein
LRWGKIRTSTVSRGKKFENQVAELYTLMGYEVKQNVGILGHQIDVILTYNLPGGIKTKTAVECKYVKSGNLRKNDVMNNIYALVDLMRNDEVHTAIICTTNGFSKELWKTAKTNKIQLLTFSELQHRILKLDNYINTLINNYETDEISGYYIDLFAQDLNSQSKLLDKFVTEWIENNAVNHLSILGEYGTGKTSFCKKFIHDLALMYKKNPLKHRIPILINLSDYSKVMGIRQLITDLLINEYGLQGINFTLFEKMNNDGLLLLIFDGFDEMAQKVVFDTAFANFSRIAELARSKKSKIILTCRTEFFRTHEKEKEILLDIDERKNFDMVYITEFNDSQIKEFLKKRVHSIELDREKKQGWQYYYEKIKETFDLSDLAKRPVLLDMIVRYLPMLIETKKEINASTLYLTAIGNELKRRLKIGKTIIRRVDRIKLMKLLATWMYNNNQFVIDYPSIPSLLNIKEHFELKTRIDIEYYLHDFLTCSFLNRDTKGNYKFSHRSFVDFLVAWKFVDDIKTDHPEEFKKRIITFEVMNFLVDFDQESPINRKRLYQWIRSTRRRKFSKTQYLGGNAISLLNELGENFSTSEISFSETVLDSANFHDQDLSNLNFRRASLRNVNLTNTNIKNADLTLANIEGATFKENETLYKIVAGK